MGKLEDASEWFGDNILAPTMDFTNSVGDAFDDTVDTASGYVDSILGEEETVGEAYERINEDITARENSLMLLHNGLDSKGYAVSQDYMTEQTTGLGIDKTYNADLSTLRKLQVKRDEMKVQVDRASDGMGRARAARSGGIQSAADVMYPNQGQEPR